MDVSILITPKGDLEFHVHIDVSNLAINIMLVQNPSGKCNQPIVYALQLLKNVEKNYTRIEREVLVYAFHKYLFDNKFFFYVDHMALLYLVKKPHLSSDSPMAYVVSWI